MIPYAQGSLWDCGWAGTHIPLLLNCLNQRQEVRKGWLLILEASDGQTHLGCIPLVMEAVPSGKDLHSPISLTPLLMERNV